MYYCSIFQQLFKFIPRYRLDKALFPLWVDGFSCFLRLLLYPLVRVRCVRGVPHTPEPLAAGLTLHLLRSASPTSQGAMTVCKTIWLLLLLSSSATQETLSFFIRFDSRRSTPGGCFPQRSLSAPYRSPGYIRAILRNLFRRPCAAFYSRAGHRSVAPRVIPQNLPRRRLRRLALAGYSRFCGNLALRGFRAASPYSPLRE